MRPRGAIRQALGAAALELAHAGIERFLRTEPVDKRPKIDVHSFDLKRKMLEKGLAFSEVHEPIRGTDLSTAAIHASAVIARLKAS